MHRESKLAELYLSFAVWLGSALGKPMSVDVVAFVFNLYESEEAFDIQVAGSAFYSETDERWAANQVFTSGEDLFSLPMQLVGSEWSDGLLAAKEFVARYLLEGPESDKLNRAQAVAVGFVDGDLEVLHKNA
jgi:hypothetical protein